MKKLNITLLICIFLSIVLTGCGFNVYYYQGYNTEPNMPKEKIALLACCHLDYAKVDDPSVSLLEVSIQRINNGINHSMFDLPGVIGLIPGQYEICANITFTTFKSTFRFNSERCNTVRFEAKVGHTYRLSPVIDVDTLTWYPEIEDLTHSSASVKSWIDEDIASAFGIDNQKTNNKNSKPFEQNDSLAIKVSNLSNPGHRPRSGDQLSAKQTLADGTSLEVEFYFTSSTRHRLTHDGYMVFYSNDGQVVNSIHKGVATKTDRGWTSGYQKVGSKILILYDDSSAMRTSVRFEQGEDGKYRYIKTNPEDIIRFGE